MRAHNALFGLVVALATASTPTQAAGPAGPQRALYPAERPAAAQWLALGLLYRGDATIVTASCPPVQDTAAQQGPSPQSAPPPPPPPATAGEPSVPPIGCPPPKVRRRPAIYVGIAVAAGGGVGAAIALGGRKSTSP